ncbi:MAG: hypothetical protein DRR04_01445 [Gammaproteobacteria bacterium]|nr:MAG: hypothetical protein DRQ97_02920 [Gammaproteobacteria bacterium]RLA62035.1 MAG: hypothetical protein DRR04_01445 [Gammaproteobacteria bacterium]
MVTAATVVVCALAAFFGITVSAQSIEPEALAESPNNVISRYQRTINSLRASAPQLQADFAGTALRELAEVYMAEADLARKQAREQESGVKLRGWSSAVDQYAGQLVLLVEDIELGLPVALQHNGVESITVMVGGRAVILSHPREDQQVAFEQRVLLDFCRRVDCKELTAATVSRQPIPVSTSQVKPVWTFTETGQVCSHEGIQVLFNRTAHLARSRGTCKQLLQEMMTLADEIAWQRRHGVSVQWRELSIRATPQRPEHVVLLNNAGDSILVTVPLLYGSAHLLDDIVPWIRGQAGVTEPVAIHLDAARYGWERTGD